MTNNCSDLPKITRRKVGLLVKCMVFISYYTSMVHRSMKWILDSVQDPQVTEALLVTKQQSTCFYLFFVLAVFMILV